jgi:hypothetical protein
VFIIFIDLVQKNIIKKLLNFAKMLDFFSKIVYNNICRDKTIPTTYQKIIDVKKE